MEFIIFTSATMFNELLYSFYHGSQYTPTVSLAYLFCGHHPTDLFDHDRNAIPVITISNMPGIDKTTPAPLSHQRFRTLSLSSLSSPIPYENHLHIRHPSPKHMYPTEVALEASAAQRGHRRVSGLER